MAIYHYTKLATLLEYILPSKMLKTGNFANMNDPRESQPWSMGSINLPLEKIFPGYYNDHTHIDCQYKFGQLVKDRFQVICFSGARKKGWNNEMMWAHYAENQRGICLEFDENVLLSSAKEVFPKIECYVQAVNYTKNKKDEKPWVCWNDQVTVEENFGNYASILSHEIVFQKSHFWKKEDEKRLLFLNTTQTLFVPYGEALKAIHVGIKFPEQQLSEIHELIKETPVKLYKLIYQNDKYVRWQLIQHDGEWKTYTEYRQ